MALRAQNPRLDRTGRIIKNNYTFEYNGDFTSINDAVLQGFSMDHFQSKWIDKLVNKKRKMYDIQNMPFSEMQPNKK